MTEAELTDPALVRQRRRLDVAKLILSGIAAVTGSVTLVVALVVLSGTTHTTSTISDCTTPQGTCYQQVQQQNAANRTRLVDGSVAANFCSRTSQTLDAMQACVTRTLAELGDR